jgi:hypothetical protein
MDFPFRGFASDVDRKLYGKNAAHVMKTDFGRMTTGYELMWTFPLQEGQIQLASENGYLTVQASKNLDRRRRTTGRIVPRSVTRLHDPEHYLGENFTEEDIKPGRGRRTDARLPKAVPGSYRAQTS